LEEQNQIRNDINSQLLLLQNQALPGQQLQDVKGVSTSLLNPR
jgi:hypothetical protein